VLDNGSVWLQACQQFGILTVKKACPYRSQDNGEMNVSAACSLR